MILFKNKGEINLDAITTFGVHVKENENPIGYFGTGLKYAIAVLLREGHEITICAGEETFEFGSVRKEIRGKEFEVVTMNDRQLGFTMDLGKNWEVWQAYRELYCNTLDENGTVKSTKINVILPERGTTKIYVKGPKIEECHKDRDKIILARDEKKLVAEGQTANAYKGRSTSIFYRGIRVHDLLLTETKFSYDVTRHVDLTEDRTLKWKHQAEFAIMDLVLRSEDPDFIREVLSCGNGTYEYDLNYSLVSTTPGRTFLEVAGQLREQNHDLDMNPSAIFLHRENVTKSVLPHQSVKLNAIQRAQLDKACEFVDTYLECDMTKYPIVILKELGHGCLGRADDGKIFLSLEVFEQGTKRVAAALYEEFTHLDTGCKDESPEQKWIYLQKILSLGEQLSGRPL